MFGIFGGKKKFIMGVQDEILKIIDIVKIPEMNETVKTIRTELKENGASQEEIESVKFNEIVAHAVSQPLEHNLDHMYKNFNKIQGAFYCISLYITNVADAEQLQSFEKEQPEMYSALKLLWYACATAIDRNYDAFAHCIIVPEKGNPFPE